MKIDIAVCGRFHYHNFIKYLDEQKVLNRLYTSYKINYSFNIINGKHINYPIKEYLMYFNIRVLKKWRFEKNLLLLHKLWEQQVALNKSSADILHVMIHGNSEKIINKYNKNSKLVIGEVVNAHPLLQTALINRELNKYDCSDALYIEQFSNEKIMREVELCDYILSPSKFVTDSFINHGVSVDKIVTIPYGVSYDHEFKYVKHIPSDSINIICVAQITFRKGQIYLIDAISRILSKFSKVNIKLTLVGSFDPIYKKCIDDLELADKFIHIEHIPHTNITNYMSYHDLLVLPSIEDGFGLVISEALSVGVPVISTKNAGASELIIDGKNGFVVDACDSDALADTIMKCLGNTFIIDSKDIPSWVDYANNMMDLYRRVL